MPDWVPYHLDWNQIYDELVHSRVVYWNGMWTVLLFHLQSAPPPLPPLLQRSEYTHNRTFMAATQLTGRAWLVDWDKFQLPIVGNTRVAESQREVQQLAVVSDQREDIFPWCCSRYLWLT